MAGLWHSAVKRASAKMRIDRASESDQLLDSVDVWGHSVPADETGAEELERLLMPINWLSDLLERMDRAPADANRYRAACQELMDRLLAGCRSPELREPLVEVGVWIAARRYRSAAVALRAVAA